MKTPEDAAAVNTAPQRVRDASRPARGIRAGAAIVLAAATLPAVGLTEAMAQSPEPVRSVDGRPPIALGEIDASAARYCENIADAAADARLQRQAAALRRLEEEIDGRIALLEDKRRETEDWLRKREQFLEMAEKGLIDIYSQMRPEAASAQLALMNDVTAAAILTRLNARVAGAILAEMDAAKAARLASIMVGIGNPDPVRRPAG